MPAVSVIIPTFNRAAMVRRAIESVRAQTFTDWELFVVDDGSGDDTPMVLQALAAAEPRLRVIRQPNAGQASAKNAALRLAWGECVAFLDDDDVWLPEKLSRQHAFLTAHPEIGLVACRGRRVGAAADREDVVPRWEGPIELRDMIRQGCIIPSMSSVMARRSLCGQIGTFSSMYRIADDFHWYLRAGRVSRLAVMPEALYCYVRHGGNLSKRHHAMWSEVRALIAAVRPDPALGVTRDDIRVGLHLHGRHHYAEAVADAERKQYWAAASGALQALRCDALVGLGVPWSRFANPLYRAARPYALLAACAALAAWGGVRPGKPESA